jgi:hypothetical protein
MCLQGLTPSVSPCARERDNLRTLGAPGSERGGSRRRFAAQAAAAARSSRRSVSAEIPSSRANADASAHVGE